MKKFRFRMETVLNMREKELEERQMEMAKILAALNAQKEKLQNIFDSQDKNTKILEELCTSYNSEYWLWGARRWFVPWILWNRRNVGKFCRCSFPI